MTFEVHLYGWMRHVNSRIVHVSPLTVHTASSITVQTGDNGLLDGLEVGFQLFDARPQRRQNTKRGLLFVPSFIGLH